MTGPNGSCLSRAEAPMPASAIFSTRDVLDAVQVLAKTQGLVARRQGIGSIWHSVRSPGPPLSGSSWWLGEGQLSLM